MNVFRCVSVAGILRLVTSSRRRPLLPSAMSLRGQVRLGKYRITGQNRGKSCAVSFSTPGQGNLNLEPALEVQNCPLSSLCTALS
jgi:hypothetical protein